MFIRIWEYEVPSSHVDLFLAAYGTKGEWAQLFERGEGYTGTDLYRSTEIADRFSTVDR